MGNITLARALRLAAIPALLSLAVTLLRLAGELGGWSEGLFTKRTLGIFPSGMTWLFGITWLAVPFGIYFAWRLASEGAGPRTAGRAVRWAFAAAAAAVGGLFGAGFVPLDFPRVLVGYWGAMAVAAAITFGGWRELARVLVVYAVAARVPVVVVMFLAMRGGWGTHYDYVGMPPQFQMPPAPRFLWLAFFPQLVFWVGYTVVVGAIAGALAYAAFFRRRPASQATRA